MAKRKAVLFRLDPKVHAELRRWADDEMRSLNAQVEFLLRKALRDAGRELRRERPEEGDADPQDG